MDDAQHKNSVQEDTNSHDIPGGKAVERIVNVLKKFDFKDKEIASILARLDMAVQEEIGQELLNRLSEDKRALFSKMVEEKKPKEELSAFFKDMITQEQMRGKIEENLERAAYDLEKWLATVDLAEEQAKKEIVQKLLKPRPTG